MKRRVWTADQERVLRRVYSDASDADLTRIFPGYSKGAIAGKASRMGLLRGLANADGWEAHHQAMQRKYQCSEEPFPFKAIHEALLAGGNDDVSPDAG